MKCPLENKEINNILANTFIIGVIFIVSTTTITFNNFHNIY